MRAMVVAHGISVTHITSPRFLLDQTTFQGLISRDEYEDLSRMLKYRNIIAHGFGTDDFDDDLAIGLIDTVRRITAAEESS